VTRLVLQTEEQRRAWLQSSMLEAPSCRDMCMQEVTTVRPATKSVQPTFLHVDSFCLLHQQSCGIEACPALAVKM